MSGLTEAAMRTSELRLDVGTSQGRSLEPSDIPVPKDFGGVPHG